MTVEERDRINSRGINNKDVVRLIHEHDGRKRYQTTGKRSFAALKESSRGKRECKRWRASTSRSRKVRIERMERVVFHKGLNTVTGLSCRSKWAFRTASYNPASFVYPPIMELRLAKASTVGQSLAPLTIYPRSYVHRRCQALS